MIRIWFNVNHVEGLFWAVEFDGKVVNVRNVEIKVHSYTNKTRDETKHPKAWIECAGEINIINNYATIV